MFFLGQLCFSNGLLEENPNFNRLILRGAHENMGSMVFSEVGSFLADVSISDQITATSSDDVT